MLLCGPAPFFGGPCFFSTPENLSYSVSPLVIILFFESVFSIVAFIVIKKKPFRIGLSISFITLALFLIYLISA